MKYSIKDIARLSGVSVPTVSRIINQTGRYSAETEAKVLRVIDETGYQPSMFAKGMRTNSSQSIGVVVPDITNEFFASITLSIQNSLCEMGYTTVICNTNEQPSMQRKQLAMLRRSHVSGIIFISGEEISDEDLNDGIPKVFVDRVPWNSETLGAVTIEVDNFQGGRIAAETLLNTGCRRIVALFDGRGLSTQVARYAGFLRAYQDHGMDFPPELYFPVPRVSFQEGYRAIRTLLDRGEKFDGVFCYADALACGAIRALTEAGISVPQQVSVIGYDNITAASWCMPALTTVEQPLDKMGCLAAELILRMSRNEVLDQRRYILSVQLIKRESTT